ncbi:MAG: methyltransferase domain-containing protein [Bryobacteraceae bacterium]|nr:methyltransferase domain-containing protein [Bryobacteraceae bacterium]
MNELLMSLAPGTRVLDLGARSGSFAAERCPGALVVRLDLDPFRGSAGGHAVQGNAVMLPFVDGAFDVVIASHSLEHIVGVEKALAEIGRVIKTTGSLFVAVPDSSTWSDRIYRWVYHGGGHVNAFKSLPGLIAHIESRVGLPVSGHRLLHSSFGFLERCHFKPRPPRRMWLFGNGSYSVVVLVGYFARLVDRAFGTRLSVYGWAISFGRIAIAVDAWSNVCVRCGTAHPREELRHSWRQHYGCPACGAWNLFTTDRNS